MLYLPYLGDAVRGMNVISAGDTNRWGWGRVNGTRLHDFSENGQHLAVVHTPPS